MSVVGIIYLTAGGRSRKKRGNIDTSQPTFLVNTANQQAHSLTNNPLFIQPLPVYVDKWEDLTGWTDTKTEEIHDPIPVPAPPLRAEKLRYIGEDNGVWGIGCIPFTDEGERQREMVTTHQEALNLAEARQARATHGNILLQWAFMGILGLCLMLVLLIAFVVVQAKFIDKPEPTASLTVGQVPQW
ncbi:hypothetical protein LCGC14_1727470 [marine sediment metagenome]|uniref:Uncharacterized protein n=1 Tax=marine sediment metagenome TaxID=412755 RepID=A0A0F9JR68_9ZZZZ